MADLATLEDFAARHGEVPAEQESVVEALLTDASALILAEVEGSEEGWVTEDGEPPQVVVSICVGVAYRAWSNPDGLRRLEAADVVAQFQNTTPEALYLTDGERRTVRRAAKRGSFAAMTLESPFFSTSAISDLDFDPEVL